jgi:hypothetical protein
LYADTSNAIVVLKCTFEVRAIAKTLQEVPELDNNSTYTTTLTLMLLKYMRHFCGTLLMKVNHLKEKAMPCQETLLTQVLCHHLARKETESRKRN